MPFGPVGLGLLKAAGNCARRSSGTVILSSSVAFAAGSESSFPVAPTFAGSASSSSISRSISFGSSTAAASVAGAGAGASAASRGKSVVSSAAATSGCTLGHSLIAVYCQCICAENQ